jgi:hypothetical protein
LIVVKAARRQRPPRRSRAALKAATLANPSFGT